MLPLLTFASGLVAGIVGVRLLKTAKTPASLDGIGDKARQGLDKAQNSLRQATVSGLTSIEKSSASLREKLTAPPAEPAAETAVEAAAEAPKAKPRPRRKKAAPAPEAGEQS